jgi:ribonuclease P protein component
MERVSQGLPKRSRLSARDGISALLQQRKRVTGQHFDLAYRANALGTARLGVAVSRKLVHDAAARNSIKRIIREGFREKRGRLGAVDLVFILKQHQPSRQAVAMEVRNLLSRLAVCQKS